MFTGIVQGIAQLVSIDKKPNFHTHVVKLPVQMLDGLKIGASVAHNGCCLTVKEIKGDLVSFDLIKETLHLTNLGKLVEGDWINIERAAKFSDEIGGHIISGHIIRTAEIIKVFTSEKIYQIWLKIRDLSLMKYILYKGFISVDGVSLTVGELTPHCFCVHLIPETLRRTTLGEKKSGQLVNIEIDPKIQAIVDSVERMLAGNNVAAHLSKTQEKMTPVNKKDF